MEDASWTRFARLAWVRGSLVKYVIVLASLMVVGESRNVGASCS